MLLARAELGQKRMRLGAPDAGGLRGAKEEDGERGKRKRGGGTGRGGSDSVLARAPVRPPPRLELVTRVEGRWTTAVED
jgi:hypothetical protein